MMANYKTRRTILVILTITAVIIVMFMIFSLIRGSFFSTNTEKSQIDISREALINTNANRSVKMTVRGLIVADENFRSYQIQISPNNRNLTTYRGYLDQPIQIVPLYNNTPAYEQFVYALDRAGLMNREELTGERNDTRGVCATGFLYEFEILKDEKSIKKLWTSSCPGSRGSLGGNVSQFTQLFIVQIPNADSVIGDLW